LTWLQSLNTLLKSSVFQKKAKNGTVAIAITIDGANLGGKLYHVTIGFKIVDLDAVDPNTGGGVIEEHAK
jgi:hypothetical protein